jgi:hypothetical protein
VPGIQVVGGVLVEGPVVKRVIVVSVGRAPVERADRVLMLRTSPALVMGAIVLPTCFLYPRDNRQLNGRPLHCRQLDGRDRARLDRRQVDRRGTSC